MYWMPFFNYAFNCFTGKFRRFIQGQTKVELMEVCNTFRVPEWETLGALLHNVCVAPFLLHKAGNQLQQHATAAWC